MKTIVSVVLLLLLATLAPKSEGASISVSNSVSTSISNTVSTSISNTVSTSISNSISITVSNSISTTYSTSISLTGVPPNTVYNLQDRCPQTPQTLCLFYQGPFTLYQISITNSSGGIFTQTTPYTQFDVTPVDTNNFYQPGKSYMVQVRGVSNGAPTGSGAMLTVSKPAVPSYVPPSANPTYIDNLFCSITSGLTTCTFSPGTKRYKNIKIRSSCFIGNSLVQSLKIRLRGKGTPQKSSFTLTLSTGAQCYIRAKAHYRKAGSFARRIRYVLLT